MRDIFSLIKIDLYAAFTTGSSARKKKKKPQTKALSLSGGRKTGLSGGKAGATLLGLFLFALIAFNFYTSGITMGGLLAESGHLEILLSSSYALATVLVLSMCIFKMPSYLYSFKDFDLLMSLPLRTSHILVSKLASLYAVNLLFAAAFGGPTLVAFGVLTGAGAQ